MNAKEATQKLKTFEEWKDYVGLKPSLPTIMKIAQKTIGFEMVKVDAPKPIDKNIKNVELIEKAFIVVLDDTNLRDFGYNDEEWWYSNSYLGTEKALRNKANKIITTSLAHLSFDLLDMGYQLYVYTLKAGMVKFYPGMENTSNKDIRFAHNIRKLVIAHFFDEDLKIDRDNL